MALAAPFASMVMDARTGQVLQSTNADTRLHPASLTKMMTLYIAFEAIENGEISLDTLVTVSAHAASEQPSKLGLRAGQKIKLRYLIRAAAIKSANDCATAIGEAIEGSEAAFARRMNRTAAALGMTRTTFKNANGLTEKGHLSTARDMTNLGRHLFYDFPEYYNLFSRRSADAGGRTVNSTNARFLNSYKGADGIKTGYTVAAGFNLVASAKRGNKRIIATVFGGTSTAARNAKVAELLDLGFKKAPSHVKVQKPKKPDYSKVDGPVVVAGSGKGSSKGAAAKSIRVSGAVTRSPRPHWRPAPAVPEPSEEMLAAIQDGIQETLEAVQEEAVASAPTDAAPLATSPAPPRPHREIVAALAELAKDDPLQAVLAAAEDPDAKLVATKDEADAAVLAALEPETPEPDLAPATEAESPVLVAEAAIAPPPRPEGETPVKTAPQPKFVVPELEVAEADTVGGSADDKAELALLAESEAPPTGQSAVAPIGAEDRDGTHYAKPANGPTPRVELASIEPESFDNQRSEPVVVTRLSTSGGRHWGINVGTYGSQYEAERVLLTTALQEISTLDEALRKVKRTKTGFDANFLGMSKDMANLACQRLIARNVQCTTLGPG
ncbi:serine hydrolase [Frigidibacter sp. SLM-1]|nr:serine hydrolase [Frigidibacter sp. ROC022]MCR8725942.1 serine hydrolase [Frigidibacter sp. ROC022]